MLKETKSVQYSGILLHKTSNLWNVTGCITSTKVSKIDILRGTSSSKKGSLHLKEEKETRKRWQTHPFRAEYNDQKAAVHAKLLEHPQSTRERRWFQDQKMKTPECWRGKCVPIWRENHLVGTFCELKHKSVSVSFSNGVQKTTPTADGETFPSFHNAH